MSARQAAPIADINSAAIAEPVLVVPDDTATFAPPGLGLTIIASGAGNLAIKFHNAVTLTIPIAVGLTILPFSPQQVLATGTTLTGSIYLNN